MNLMKACALVTVGLLSSSLATAVCYTSMAIITKPDSIYIDHLDGTVTDIETGMMWQKCPQGTTYNAGACDNAATTFTWQAALATAQTANTNADYGYSDWRLPNVKELDSLIDFACSGPAMNPAMFPSGSTNNIWTSTPNVDTDSSAFAVTETYGRMGVDVKSALKTVRLVRDAQ